MVDVDTAMHASAYGGRKKKRGEGDKDDDKSSRKIEPFRPDETAVKEVADAYSMWLVIVMGLSVSLFMRYVLMPTMTEPSKVLWVLPLGLAAVVPSVHKVVIPAKYYDLYTNGNWFRACFLFVFSWLALSFVLSNPPIADIAAPMPPGGIDIQEADGIADSKWRGGTYTIELDRDEAHIVMGMAVSDNIDSAGAHVMVTLIRGDTTYISVNDTAENLTEENELFESLDQGEWLRGNKTGLTSKKDLGPRVSYRADDLGLAWDLGMLGPGTYLLHIEMSESRDNMGPWDTNTWTADWTIKISQTG